MAKIIRYTIDLIVSDDKKIDEFDEHIIDDKDCCLVKKETIYENGKITNPDCECSKKKLTMPDFGDIGDMPTPYIGRKKTVFPDLLETKIMYKHHCDANINGEHSNVEDYNTGKN